MTSPKQHTAVSVKSTQRRQQRLITNITGQASDKMKLSKRLNDAVDDLIKMGQKYKEKSLLIQDQIPTSNVMSSYNQTQFSAEGLINSKDSFSVHDVTSGVTRVRQPKTQLG